MAIIIVYGSKFMFTLKNTFMNIQLDLPSCHSPSHLSLSLCLGETGKHVTGGADSATVSCLHVFKMPSRTFAELLFL